MNSLIDYLKKILIGLSALFFISNTSFASKVSYDLSFDGKTISGTRNFDGKAEKFNFPAEEERGLVLVSRRLIAKKLDDSLRAGAIPFCFANPEQTEISIKTPSDYFVFSSFAHDRKKYKSKLVSQFVIAFAKKSLWTKTQFQFQGTHFELINPTSNRQIEPKHWETSVKRIWTAFTKKFGSPTDHLVFADLDGPISGGPLGENVLGIFATEKISPEIQEDMEANLGWAPQPTTRAYVEANYPKSASQWEEYLFGTYAHEIGHLFFGFGLTREKVTNADELWFSLGLGVLNDMEVTEEFLGRKPQLELDIIKSWETKYAKLFDIDQRLINPDRANDKKYPFDRKKVFAHGKAAFYLEKLREKVGKAAFDGAVKEYVKKCRECKNGYGDFKQFLPDSKDIDTFEKQFQIATNDAK